MALGKNDDAVGWLRSMLKGPIPGISLRPQRPSADINRLDDVFAGKADIPTSVELLRSVHDVLRWLTWRTDWLQAYVRTLLFEAVSRDESLSKEEARKRLLEAIGVTQASIRIMEDNPLTPHRILDDVRAQLKRLDERQLGS
jgi:hypothetical protein